MQIKGADGYSPEMIRDEVERGGRLVIYLYCVSILVMTFKRPTEIHFIRAGQSPVARGLPYTLVTFLFGWWGFPWGPIYSLESLFKNFRGGVDVTDEVLATIMRHDTPTSLAGNYHNSPDRTAVSGSSAAAGTYTPPRAPLPPRQPSFNLSPRVIAIGVAALVALAFTIFATSSYHAGQHLQVAVLNGLPTRTSIKINDGNVVIAPFGYELIQVPQGDIKIGATALTPAETIQVKTDFWTRLFSPQIVIINPDRLGLFSTDNVVYTAPDARGDFESMANWKLLTNQSHYVFPEPDYAFVKAPENHSLPKGSTVLTKTRISIIPAHSIDQRMDVVGSNLNETGVKAYAIQLATLLPDSRVVPNALIHYVDSAVSIPLIQPHLTERPIRVEWHRAYQNINRTGSAANDLQPRYAELVAQNPEDGSAYYLRGRIAKNPDAARTDYQRALSASKPSAYAHLALAGLDSTAAHFEESLTHFDAAIAAGIDDREIREQRCNVLIALHRSDEWLKDIAKRRGIEDEEALNIEELYATAANPATKFTTMEALSKKALVHVVANTEPKQVVGARLSVNLNLAYATGDETTYVRLLASREKNDSASLAIARHDLAGVARAAKNPNGVSLDEYLSFYLIAMQAGETTVAQGYWDHAARILNSSNDDKKIFADQIAGRTPLDLGALLKADIHPVYKALLFASLGFQKPEHRTSLFAMAAQQNYLPYPPHLLIDSIVRPTTASAPKTTSL